MAFLAFWERLRSIGNRAARSIAATAATTASASAPVAAGAMAIGTRHDDDNRHDNHQANAEHPGQPGF